MSTEVQRALTVMTFNVGNGLARPGRLVDLLNGVSADVVGLQEVDADQADAIERGTTGWYPYRVVRGSGFSGRALLSRHPVLDSAWLELSPSRSDLQATIALSGVPIGMLVAHPDPPRLRRRGIVFDTATVAQIDRLAEITASAAPAVLLGDFNMSPRHPSHARLVAAGLVDAYRAAGLGRGATFPLRPGRMRRINHRLSWLPLPAIARMDYVWHTADLTTLDAWLGPGTGSDHRPVLARLAFADAAARGC